MYGTILAAVDGSPRSRAVVDAAVDVAERFDGRVHLFRAVSVPPDFPAAAHNAPDPIPDLLDAEARRSLEDLARVSPRCVVEPVDRESPQAWQAVLRAAARLDADLIVVGSHGYHGWDRILGTNAARITNHADRNVLVVHPRAETPRPR